MKKSARRMCAFVLAAAMMIPLAGCKKGKSKGKGSSGPRKDYVEEDDPYFSSNEVELKIDPPENSDKEIESQELYSPRIVGGKVMSEYYLSYKMPKDIQEKVDSFDWESGDYAEIEKIYFRNVLRVMKDAVRLYTARPEAGSHVPVISFNIGNMDSEQVAAMLDRHQIAVRAGLHCAPLAHQSYGTQEQGTVRAVMSAFNNEKQIDTLANLVNNFVKLNEKKVAIGDSNVLE